MLGTSFGAWEKAVNKEEERFLTKIHSHRERLTID